LDSGSTVVASGNGSAHVFTQPAGGWSTENQAAQLIDTTGAQLGNVAIDGQTIVATASYPNARVQVPTA
jgi:hypothetical protein